MRGKVAKYLRKKAEQLTRGWKGRRLVRRSDGSLFNADCTRAMYLSFKKARKAKKV